VAKLLEALAKWRGRAGRGPKVEVPLPKLLLLLRILGSEGPIGRYALVDRLKLGEGVVRSMLSMLAKQGFVEVKRGRGCKLTPEGLKELEALLRSHHIAGLKPLDAPHLRMGAFNVAVQVKGAASKVRMGVEQRDEAVKAGALGAITLVFKGGRLLIPGVEKPLEEADPKLAEAIQGLFQLEEGDVVALCSSNERWVAEEAALAVAFSLTA
jgi:DNA-binding MarR family transcriptional regulator